MLIAVTNIYKNFSNVILKRLFQSPTGCSWSRAFHTYMGAQLLHFTALPLKNPCIQLVLGQHSIPVKGQVINIWAFQAILSLTQSLNSTTVAQKQPSKDVVLCANKTLFKKKKNRQQARFGPEPHLPTLVWTCGGLCKRFRSDTSLFHQLFNRIELGHSFLPKRRV